ncbi:tripartite tricarboxylate transporter TctB family protein [Ramlibacter sp. USB13]|uniref:Tripartite tricarboxylate transporter TctB family protein n=1 Tax=Ramlibacter cellulosilyticus TaxID=2764187 RepID=A0A923MPC1_9BURK|nr:tripartite tricarboxylate transporter TctB family protein [Ramlibacter cellulosilyticus]MBC5782099.1 tripartite tricarboxylate transporter TctB family protein [Ramlibacter cellulosilyticus]
MKLRIRNQKDVAAGVVYVLAGAGFSLGALNYKLGDAARMGPGWFPFWVGILLVLVGIATAAAGVRVHAAEEHVKRPEFGTIAWILGAVVLFGVLLQHAGLVLSLAVLVIVSSLGSHEFKWRATLVNAAVLIAFSVGVFIRGIHLQIPLWPTFLQ